MSRQPRRSAWVGPACRWARPTSLMLVLLYLPIALLFVFSFNSNTSSPSRCGASRSIGTRGLRRRGPARSARNSLLVGVGQPGRNRARAGGQLAFVRFRFRGRTPLLGLAVLPLIVPFIVLGVALFLLFTFVDVPRSLLTIAVGHAWSRCRSRR